MSRRGGCSPFPWLGLLLAVLLPAALQAGALEPDWDGVRDESARLLSGYIQVDTTNPPGGELAGAEYLRRWFASQGMDARTYVSVPGRGNLVAWLPATHPTPGGPGPLLLLSHIDVVPAEAEDWSFPPFSGAIREGAVHGRGAIDDKGHGASFAMALVLLARSGAPRIRDLVFCATADEEVAGAAGAAFMIEHHWEALGPPAVVWNEGGVSAGVELLDGLVVNGIATTEKRALWLHLRAEGKGGHGSQPHPDAANERLLRALARIDATHTPLRLTPVVAEQFRRLGAELSFPRGLILRSLEFPLLLRLLGGVLTSDRLTNAMVRDTIAITGLRSGLKHNVIPRKAVADLDVRLLPDTDAADFLAWLEGIVGDDQVRIETGPAPRVAPPSPHDHPLFRALEAELSRELPGSITVPMQTSGGTDSNLFRLRGVPAYGYQPALYSAELSATIHGLDERLPLRELEREVRVAYRVLRRLTRP